MSKISIRFYKDHKVRAVWDEEHSFWWFSVLDIVGAINVCTSACGGCIKKEGGFTAPFLQFKLNLNYEKI